MTINGPVAFIGFIVVTTITEAICKKIASLH